jgi:hypothetical protein
MTSKKKRWYGGTYSTFDSMHIIFRTVRSIGQPQMKGKIPVTVRTVQEIKVGDNVQQFLELMGYK